MLSTYIANHRGELLNSNSVWTVAPGKTDQDDDESGSRRSGQSPTAESRRTSRRSRPGNRRPTPGTRQGPGPVKEFFLNTQLSLSKAFVVFFPCFPFWSRSFP